MSHLIRAPRRLTHFYGQLADQRNCAPGGGIVTTPMLLGIPQAGSNLRRITGPTIVMHSSVHEKLPQVAEICRRHHVKRLELFGSALDERFDPEHSDVDFVVEFMPEATAGFACDYFGLKKDLEILLGRTVDLAMGRAVRNPYFRQELDETKLPIHAA